MTKVNIISGFLGAGKTTLIKKLIEDGAYEGEKLVLIENEFGEIGIDGGFLQDSKIEVSELNSGCICCSLVGDFTENMKSVIKEYAPDRILIEPSGVAGLSDVLSTIDNVGKIYPLNVLSSIVVVNAIKAIKQMKAFGEFFNNQVENANTIVLSRTDSLDEKKLKDCVDMLKQKNPDASIITTPWTDLPVDTLLAAIEKKALLTIDDVNEHHHHDEDCDCGCHDHEHEHHHEHHHEHNESCDCGCHEHENEHHHEHLHEHNEDCDCGCHDHGHEHHHEHHHNHEADDTFISFGIETPQIFEKSKIESALKSICNDEKYETILRAKGIVKTTDDNWIHFDMVPGEYEIRDGSADYTGRLSIIGTSVDEADIKALFGIC